MRCIIIVNRIPFCTAILRGGGKGKNQGVQKSSRSSKEGVLAEILSGPLLRND